MSVAVGLLSPRAGDPGSELRTVLRQLALLWKFDLHEIDGPGGIAGECVEGPLFVDLSVNEPAYHDMVGNVVAAWQAPCILFLGNSLTINEPLQDIAGVKGAFEIDCCEDLDLMKVRGDRLLAGVDEHSTFFDFHGRKALSLDTGRAEPLLQSANGYCVMAKCDGVYTLSLPCWQFGIVSYPAWFNVMENAIFFSRGFPHVAPGPYVAFRIDDVPVTGESYIKQGYSNAIALGEIREIQRAERLHGARIEYMLSSHVLSNERCAEPADRIAGKALQYIKSLCESGRINLGVHGYLHLDAAAYRKDGTLLAKEFLSLDGMETRATLTRLQDWLRDRFGKQPSGFVAPAWGYREDVTKSAGREFFSYVADSNQHLQEGTQPDLFGSVFSGCVSMYETWRSGMSGICMADRNLFRGFLGPGLPVHLMFHGSLVSDPLQRRDKVLLILLGMVLAASVAAAFGAGMGVAGVIFAVTVMSLATLGVYRKRRYLGWLIRQMLARWQKGGRVVDVARAAAGAGARWMFVEEMAAHMKSYDSLSVRVIGTEGDRLQIRFNCRAKFVAPFSVHFPAELESVDVCGGHSSIERRGSVIYVQPGGEGTLDLTVQLRG